MCAICLSLELRRPIFGTPAADAQDRVRNMSSNGVDSAQNGGAYNDMRLAVPTDAAAAGCSATEAPVLPVRTLARVQSHVNRAAPNRPLPAVSTG